MFLIYFLYL